MIIMTEIIITSAMIQMIIDWEEPDESFEAVNPLKKFAYVCCGLVGPGLVFNGFGSDK